MAVTSPAWKLLSGVIGAPDTYKQDDTNCWGYWMEDMIGSPASVRDWLDDVAIPKLNREIKAQYKSNRTESNQVLAANERATAVASELLRKMKEYVEACEEVHKAYNEEQKFEEMRSNS